MDVGEIVMEATDPTQFIIEYFDYKSCFPTLNNHCINKDPYPK